MVTPQQILEGRGHAHLRPVHAAVVLGAPLGVGVLHQGQVLQGRAPPGRRLLPGTPPQQAQRHGGGVEVLKGDLRNLKHTNCEQQSRR